MHAVAFILTCVGGINWLLVGLLKGRDLFDLLGMGDSTVATIVYILVGLSTVYLIITHKKTCKMCDKMGGSNMGAPKMGM